MTAHRPNKWRAHRLNYLNPMNIKCQKVNPYTYVITIIEMNCKTMHALPVLFMHAYMYVILRPIMSNEHVMIK